jgi:hypothetical protein
MTRILQKAKLRRSSALVAQLLSFGMICSAIGNANAASLVFTTQSSPPGGRKLGLPPVVASGQVAPLQLNSKGRAFLTSLTPPGRKLDFLGLTTTGSSGLFQGVNGIQWIGNPGNPGILRSDYLAPLAGTCSPPTIWGGGTCDWSGMEFTLRPFYFLGDSTCIICGLSNAVSLVNLTGSGKRTVSNSTSPVTIEDSVETLFSNIVFGTAVTPRAKVRYTARNSYISGDVSGSSFDSDGVITFEEVPVPGPLPILGGSVAISFSRKLRRRLRLAKKNT